MVTDTNFGANENPTFVDGCNIDGKRGVYIKGEHVIHLDAPEIYFPENAPLDTDKRELYDILNELFQGGSGGGDDWSPPEWWISVPEPDDYDIYMLVKAGDWVYDGMKTSFRLYTETQSGGLITGYDVSCDWGDGNEETLSRSESTHTYAEQGMYLVHIVGNENAYIWDGSHMEKNLLIFKSGEKIACNKSLGFAGQNALSYVKINNSGGLNLNGDISGMAFQQCYSLKKVSITSNVTVIYLRAFENCRGLEQVNFPNCKTIRQLSFQGCSSIKTISFPNVTSIDDSAFTGCFHLQKAYFPNCKSIGSQAFYNCNNLQEIIVSDDCTFGANCFQNCYSLYPRPDGSVN